MFYMHCDCFIKLRGFYFRGQQVTRKNSDNDVPEKFVCIRYYIYATILLEYFNLLY